MSGSPQPSMRFLNFLAARLDEDQQAAQAAGGESWNIHLYDKPDVFNHGIHSLTRTIISSGEVDTSDGLHIVRHHPARVLREIEAKRKIMKRHFRRRAPDWDRQGQVGFECAQCLNEFPCPTLQLLADAYHDHPDYRVEWRPRL